MVLGDKSDARQYNEWLALRRMAKNAHIAAAWLQQSNGKMQQRSLSGAVWSHQRRNPANRQRQRAALQSPTTTLTTPVSFAQIVRFQCKLAYTHTSSSCLLHCSWSHPNTLARLAAATLARHFTRSLVAACCAATPAGGNGTCRR